jgi:hypothetical protein
MSYDTKKNKVTDQDTHSTRNQFWDGWGTLNLASHISFSFQYNECNWTRDGSCDFLGIVLTLLGRSQQKET